MSNKTQTDEKVLYQGCQFPPHLAALAQKIDKQNEQYGFTDFSKIKRENMDDFHPIHAMVK